MVKSNGLPTSINHPCAVANAIYDEVIAVLQQAEELGGPEGADYVRLMEQLAQECKHRADVARRMLAPRLIGTKLHNGEATIIAASESPAKSQRGQVYIVTIDCGDESALRWATGEFIAGDAHWTGGHYFETEEEAMVDHVERAIGGAS